MLLNAKTLNLLNKPSAPSNLILGYITVGRFWIRPGTHDLVHTSQDPSSRDKMLHF